MAYVPVPKDLTKIKTKVIMPFFLFAMYERNGMPFEQILRNIVEARFRHTPVLPHQTNNFYTVLQR